MELPYTLAGLVVGLIVGLTGIGGGALMTPLLVLGFNVPPLAAVGTDLLYAAATKTTGVWVHWRHGTVNWRIVRLLALGSVPGALSTLLILNHVAIDASVLSRLITTGLSIALILTALVLFGRGWLDRRQGGPCTNAPSVTWRTPCVALMGFTVGAMVSLTSIGAGALGTALLVMLYPQLRGAHIVGTDLAHAVPLAAIAGLGHLHMGSVDLALLMNLLLGSLPGVYLGSRLATRLPDHVLRPVLATLLLLVGIRCMA